MIKRTLGLIGFLLLTAGTCLAQASSRGWVPVRFIQSRPPADSQAWNPDTIVFRNGRRLTSNLWSVAYVGQLARMAGPPFLVLSAIGCYDCDDMTHIYIALVSDAGLQTDQTPYSYPGAITPLESDTVVFRSRLFMGRCLNSPTELLLWFQDQRDSSGEWHHSVYHVQVRSDTLVRGRMPPPVPSLEATVRRVQSGHCRELPPRDQVEY